MESPSRQPISPGDSPSHAERLRVALAATPIVIFNQDRDLRYTWVGNPSLGLRAEEAIGRTDGDLLGAEAAQPLTTIKRRVLATGQRERQEVCVTRQGQSAWYDLTVEPLRDAAGVVVGITGVALDVSKRKQAEAALAASEAVRRQALESAPDAVFAVDREYRLIFNNPLHQQILADTGGRPLHPGDNALSPDYPPEVVAHWRTLYDRAMRGERFSVDFTWHDRDGNRRFVDNHFSPLRDPEGNIMGALIVARDVSARRRAEEALAVSEARLKAIVEHGPVGIALGDLEGRLTFANPAFRAILGYDEQELVGMNFRTFTVEADLDAELALVAQLRAGQVGHYDIEKRYRRKDGQLIWVQLRATALRDPAGEPVAGLAVVQDISARKQAETALRESEVKFSSIFHKSPVVIGISRVADGKIVNVNDALLRFYGYTREELIGHTPEELGLWNASKREAVVQLLREQPGPHVVEMEARCRNGEIRNVLTSVDRIQLGGEACLVGFLSDITERKRLEAEHAESTARLAVVEERERGRLARDLHDQTAQRLVALAVDLKNLETDLAAGPPPGQRVRKLRQALDDLDQEVRNLAWNLRARESVLGGLALAVPEYIEEWSQRTSVPVDCECRDVEARRLPTLVENTIYRVVQEALANVAKHARARRVSLLLEVDATLVRLTVEDDGCGFDPETGADPGESGLRLGLLGMRERVGLVGGTLVLESAPGAGTTVLVRIPLPPEAKP